MLVVTTRTSERAVRKLLSEKGRRAMEAAIVADPGRFVRDPGNPGTSQVALGGLGMGGLPLRMRSSEGTKSPESFPT